MSNAVAILTMDSINALECKELKQELTTYLQAGKGINNSRWIMANAIYNVVKSELFNEDFDTDKEFYEYIGLKKSNASQLVNAMEFVERENVDVNTITVGKAYALSTLTLDEYHEFNEWILDNDIDITIISDKGLAELIRDWRQIHLMKINEVDEGLEEYIEESKEPQKNVEETVEDKESIILHIILTMQENGITVDDIIEKLNN